MESKRITPIRFRGSPRNVEGIAHLTPQQSLSASLWLDLDLTEEQQQGLTLQTETLNASVARLRVSLPESVPPGRYRGTVQVEGERRPITVEIEPNPHLTIAPSQLSIQVRPGSQATVGLTVLNTGNVSCEINNVYAFGLFDVAGAERSIGAALRGTVEKGQGHFERLMKEAADNHGGLVRVSMKDGVGLMEPGELRDLKATLRFSSVLKPGHTYSGTWPMFNLRYGVRVYVLNPPADKAT